MKAVAVLIAVLLLPAYVLAAAEYDACVQEEKTLRAQDKDRCSGLSYLLNPSGCFAVQKAIRAYNNGKCPGIIRAGNIQPAPNPPMSPPAETTRWQGTDRSRHSRMMLPTARCANMAERCISFTFTRKLWT